jgi:epoxide hydrolase-like predicted phosphatase
MTSGAGERGLLLDYGGVLTTPVGDSFGAWERAHGYAPGEVIRLVREAYDDADGGLIGRFERGEVSTEEFDAELARIFSAAGRHVPAGSLVDAILARMQPWGEMWSVAAQARAAGIPTGLLSNSWGTNMYPRDLLAEHFDVQVISCEVGLRKPDAEIYHLAADRLGLPPDRCAFVDDLDRNVDVAEELGMFGVLHVGDMSSTVARLREFLGVELQAEGSPV